MRQHFHRFCATATCDTHPLGAKPKFRIFLPQPQKENGHRLVSVFFFVVMDVGDDGLRKCDSIFRVLRYRNAGQQHHFAQNQSPKDLQKFREYGDSHIQGAATKCRPHTLPKPPASSRNHKKKTDTIWCALFFCRYEFRMRA